MKSPTLVALLTLITLLIGTGCESRSSGLPNMESSSDGQAVILQSTGVKECDEVIALIDSGLRSTDEGFFAKAARELLLNTAKEEIAKQVEKEKDPAKLVTACAKVKKNIDGQLSGGQN
jgi:hypothetical protein